MNKFLEKISGDISAASNMLQDKILSDHRREDLHNPLIHRTNAILMDINKEFDALGLSVEDNPSAYRQFLIKKIKQRKELYEDYRPRHANLIAALQNIPSAEIPGQVLDSDRMLDRHIEDIFSE